MLFITSRRAGAAGQDKYTVSTKAPLPYTVLKYQRFAQLIYSAK